MERVQYLAGVTLAELRDREFFAAWREYPPENATVASRRIMASTIEKLIALGSDAPKDNRLAVLQHCIESFNEIDAEMDHFIETVEREDICEEFEAIVHACGLGDHEDLAGRWRDW